MVVDQCQLKGWTLGSFSYSEDINNDLVVFKIFRIDSCLIRASINILGLPCLIEGMTQIEQLDTFFRDLYSVPSIHFQSIYRPYHTDYTGH